MRRLVVVPCALALMVACGYGGPSATPTSPTARPSSTARLRVVEPRAGAVVPPSPIPVVIELQGARLLLKNPANPVIRPDEGHIHVILDGRTLSLLEGLTFDLAKVAGGPLAPGQHELRVEFSPSDHSFFDPRVIEAVPFIVR